MRSFVKVAEFLFAEGVGSGSTGPAGNACEHERVHGHIRHTIDLRRSRNAAAIKHDESSALEERIGTHHQILDRVTDSRERCELQNACSYTCCELACLVH
ncbi:hypothetical protein Mapa_012909 [Marchantia paleacea]|nr:hypothetical protein Mapa_012909 [Marchantia paleacea]